MNQDASWREKYKKLAREFEVLEKQQNRAADQSKQLFQAMALGMQGANADLDSSLARLNQHFSEGEQVELKPVIKEIMRHSRDADSKKVRISDELRNTLTDWSRQIEKLDRDKAKADALSDILVQLPEATEALYSVSPLVKRLVQLQDSLLAVALADTGASQAKGGDKAAFSRKVTKEVVQWLTQLTSALQKVGADDQLVQQVVNQLSGLSDPQKIAGVIADLVRLVQQLEPDMTQEFEDYLLSLNEQLGVVEQFLIENRHAEHQALLEHKELEKALRRDVNVIHSSVKSSKDLNALKVSVTSQLAKIVRTMDNYRKGETDREGQLQARYDKLLEKVRSMEVESEHIKARIEEEQRQARTDVLTGLPNRLAYIDQVKAELARTARYGAPFSFCVADIDHFKPVNDQYGHPAGDKLLSLLSKTLRRELRETDFVARIGGEEFAFIFTNTQLEQAKQVAEKLREAVQASPFHFQGTPITITMSFGLVEVSGGESADELYARADRLLYQAKGSGRNCVAIE
ncbi:sensor domain-containing diguanylate cyclase [Nitrincola sp. MINF-07-Sa-05]|uniref:sensor domain-containing diguanylate cyclase n=1 Tax=Nitrincola salilacus TaxID=3400273 RepID=UPI0039184DB6